MPERWAHASIVFGQYEEPYVQTFRVGPLPISNATTCHTECRAVDGKGRQDPRARSDVQQRLYEGSSDGCQGCHVGLARHQDRHCGGF
jgi:hypothetical protein